MPPGSACRATGSAFPPCGVDDLPQVLRGTAAGGALEQDGMVEVVSSLERDGRPVFRDLRWGVYVVLKAPNEYARACFKEYGLKTDAERLVRGDVQALSPDRAGTRHVGAVGGVARRADRASRRAGAATSVAVAKRDLRAGETLDGEGGYTVWGKLVPAERSLAEGALPIGLAHKVPLVRDIAAGEIVALGRCRGPRQRGGARSARHGAALRAARSGPRRAVGAAAAPRYWAAAAILPAPNAGMTSLANRSRSSSCTSSGVPSGVAQITRSTPG